MIFGVNRRVTYMADREGLAISSCDREVRLLRIAMR